MQMLRRHGAAAFNRFNGMYAGAFFDPARKRLLLFRDRFGIKPLYYREHGGDFLFASEIKPLLAASGPAAMRKATLGALFTYRYLPGEETVFAGIRRLPPGSCLVYDLLTATYKIERYWEYRFPEVLTKLSWPAAEERFHELFIDAVRLRLRSDVEVGSFLSGGVDSSAVAAAAADIQPQLSLFNISFSASEYNELPQVRDFMAAGGRRFQSATLYSRTCSSRPRSRERWC